MTVTASPVAAGAASASAPVLEVTELRTVISGRGWTTAAVDGVSFSIGRGETLALVGESGSGKSLTALSILRLVEAPVAVAGGSVRFEGRELLDLPDDRMRAIRGAAISMVFQEPMTSLDPAFTIGAQLRETLLAHRKLRREEVERASVSMLERVGIADAPRRMRAYPHEFSGGMRQRVMIAMALLLDPRLLLADEPTTALDVTTQAQVLELIQGLQQEMGLSILLISHDLGAVLDVADRVAVMYAGQIVEVASAADLVHRPRHPYTRALLRSKLALTTSRDPIPVIEGQVPGLRERPVGCRFAPRCPRALPACSAGPIALEPDLEPGRASRCINPGAPEVVA
jgi:oligopeptide/dipeptide ABC transporter ATP-binding protein